MNANMIISAIFVAILGFASMARGAHDLWSATLVHVTVLLFAAATIINTFFIKKRERMILPHGGPLLFFILACLLSYFWASNPSESLMSLKDILISSLLFILATNLLTSEKRLELFAVGMLPFLFIQGLVVISQFAHTKSFENPGTLVNANIQAGYFLFWFPVVLDRTMAAWARSAREKWGWMIGLLVLLIALWLTGSVTAFLFGLVIFFLWCHRMGFQMRRILVITSCMVVLLIFVKVILPGGERGILLSSLVNRLAWWETALKIFHEFPWTGVGIGNFPSAFLQFKVPSGENTLYVHSWPLQILSEMGLVGFVASLGLLTSIILAYKKAKNLSHLKFNFVLGAFGTLLFCCLNVGAEYFLYILTGAIFISVVPPLKPSSVRLRTSWAVVVSIGLLAFIPHVISPFLASRFEVTGQEYMKEKRWYDAEEAFQKAIAIDPQNWEAYHGMAQHQFTAYIDTFKEVYLLSAIEYQKKALERNKLNLSLKAELEQLVNSAVSF